MGYHRLNIEKGKLGDISKIREEFEELMDAHDQKIDILEICELADLIGAIEAYAKKWNLTMGDLVDMKEATKRAFKDGSRK